MRAVFIIRDSIVGLYIFLICGTITGLTKFGVPGIIFSLSAFAMFYLTILNYRKVFSVLKYNKTPSILMISIIFVCFLSTFWSIDPFTTFTSSIYLFMTSMAALFLIGQYGIQTLILVKNCLAAAIVLSLLIALAVPSIGQTASGEWIGLFTTKNVFARVAVIAAALTVASKDGVQIKVMVYMICLLAVFLAKSTAAQIIILIIPFIYLSVNLIKYDLKGKILLFSLIVSGIFFISRENISSILPFLGKDISLTGRAALWEQVITYITEKPYLGYGFSAFWEPNNYGDAISISQGWEVPHSHNVWLDTMLDIGYLGVLPLILFIVNSVIKVFGRNLINISSYVPLVIVLLFSFSESSLLRANSILWVVVISSSFLICKDEAKPES